MFHGKSVEYGPYYMNHMILWAISYGACGQYHMKVSEPEIVRIGSMTDSRTSSNIDLFVDWNFGAFKVVIKSYMDHFICH